ncbi:MAG: hypothetical protein P0Y53_19160 [Candidatus Pseudobacter hemicellulosilyticus]|uniref:Uncharacterized protein n=1 Tax=Candidatus Pseudobacter hemicellulosilyticus TaxID=3121375 RepID=A0AAJ6BGX8_9BACT|nr:MAG: hypothetical protein P0Y53_19160 [Pseudobacter sp.]
MTPLLSLRKTGIFLVPFGLLLLTSCATIILNKSYEVPIYSNQPNAQVKMADTQFTLPARINLKRSKEDLKLTLIIDSVEKDYIVEAGPNPTFVWLNLAGLYAAPFYYAVDLTNPKRFYYGKLIVLDTRDSICIIRNSFGYRFNKYMASLPVQPKGRIDWHFSLPHMNSYAFRPNGESTRWGFGFFGLSTGLDYYHRDGQFLQLTIAGITNILVPFPAPIDLSGEHEAFYALTTSLSNNHRFGRLSLGYGLSYSRNTWEWQYHDRFDPPPPSRAPVTKTLSSFGGHFSGYFQTGKHFQIGAIYRPGFFRPGADEPWAYEHSISVDFAWKIRLRKGG